MGIKISVDDIVKLHKRINSGLGWMLDSCCYTTTHVARASITFLMGHKKDSFQCWNPCQNGGSKLSDPMINEVNRGFMNDVTQHNLFSWREKGVEKISNIFQPCVARRPVVDGGKIKVLTEKY